MSRGEELSQRLQTIGGHQDKGLYVIGGCSGFTQDSEASKAPLWARWSLSLFTCLH